ncbi:MAG: EAL domain-containing protein [Pseudomonadales bacterium]|nr:EAL domain-containing protein [Pseudomonadales bacterium]
MPHGLTVHFQVENPVLLDVMRGLPFAAPSDCNQEHQLIIVDSIDALARLQFQYAIYLNISCAPIDLPQKTIALYIQPGEKFEAQLISIISTISQGNAASLLDIQANYLKQLNWVTSGLEECLVWVNERYEVLYFSENTAKLFKLSAKKLLGKTFAELVNCEQQDLHSMLDKRAVINAPEKLEIEGRLENGSILYLEVGIRTIAKNRYLLNLIDAFHLRAADKRFIELANYDPITGLANRGLFLEVLQHAIGRSKNSGRLVAIILLDLHHFNRISDETGVQVGDELLRKAAERIKHLLHDQDLLARWGGDELAIIMEDLEQPETVRRIAQRIISVLSNPFVIAKQDFYVSPSIGIAVYPEADKTINGLIQAANTAMFEAKKSDGLHTYRFYQDKLQEDAEQRTLIEQHLRRALDNKEFKVFYQPKISLSQERVIGFEALLRWQHPEWKDVSPGVYIPIAEECGLITQIGDWVMRQACLKMGQWHKEFPQMEHCSIAVNVSPRQLNDPYFAGRIATILAESKLMADKLEIEITESAVMENPEQGIKILTKIHELGVRISIDDFGTGYSSLSYLKRLPIDCVKIDRSFVVDIGKDESTESIIQAILVMSSKLGLFNVAEGIENSTQMAFFESTQCDILQGYMFSKPKPEDEIELMFSESMPALHNQLSKIVRPTG